MKVNASIIDFGRTKNCKRWLTEADRGKTKINERRIAKQTVAVGTLNSITLEQG